MNIFKSSVIFAIAVSSVCAFAANPFAVWNFDKFNAQKKIISSNGIVLWNVKLAAKAGVNGTNGILCTNKASGHTGNFKYIADCKEFTWEIKFKLDKDVNKRFGNALICYGKNSYGRGQALFWITPKKCLQYLVIQRDKKVKQTLTSKVLDIKPNVWYTARVAVRNGAESKIYLDDVEVASQEKDSVAFSGITAKIPKGYPLFTVGRDLRDLAQIYRPLYGTVDDVKIWKTFEPAVSATPDKK